ncbi:MAG TPA: hypothetical protein VGZ02_02785 [Candidatus Baltobacteraceae bacterium]|jgi:thiol-disulfide isomerase/thioredoxin|nr:hypothetical protein [Candidatus Baltobacteraceae bacterium]
MAIQMRSLLPSFDGAAAWVNGEPTKADLHGRAVLVHFWSISCGICHTTAQAVNEWRDRFGDDLVLISIHQPRSPKELDIDEIIADALKAMHMTQHCAIDNDHAIVSRFGNQFVPGFYLFDRNHEFRHFQAGDKGHDRIVAIIERIVNERAAA